MWDLSSSDFAGELSQFLAGFSGINLGKIKDDQGCSV